MSEWVETTLGAVARFQNGYPFKPTELTGQGLPVVRIKQLLDPAAEVDRSNVDIPGQFRIHDGDLIFSWSGTLAVRMWSRGDALLNQHLFRVSEADGVDRRWLHYALDRAVDELLLKVHGTTMKHVTKRTLEAHPVMLPSPPEQRRIAEVMSSVDAQIGALEAEHAALNLAYTDALSLLWTDELGDEADLCRLSDLMTLDVDRVKVDAPSKYPIAGVLNAGKGLISRGVMIGSDTDYSTLNKMRAGQVVMRKLTAWEGPISVVTDEFDGYFASVEFPTFSLKPGLSARYFDHVCRTQMLLDEMKNRVTGTVQRRKRLNPDQLLDVRLPVPPLRRQETVADALDAMYDGLALLTEELAALRRVRSDLLTALMSRDITVDEAVDQFIEEAA